MSGAIWFVLRWVLKLLPLAVIVALMHFYLPGHDIVRIVGTDVSRVDRTSQTTVVTEGQGTVTVTRDVRFINAARPNGEVAVYRNEDTGWGFPWYFKFTSGNLQALAQDLVSDKAAPRWVEVTHYGWRLEIFSMFPNAVEVEPVEDPEVTIIPWFNIAFIVILIVVVLLIRRTWLRFLERLMEDERFDNAANSADQVWRWFKANLRGLRGRFGGTG